VRCRSRDTRTIAAGLAEPGALAGARRGGDRRPDQARRSRGAAGGAWLRARGSGRDQRDPAGPRKEPFACSSGCSSADLQARWSTSRRRSPIRGAARRVFPSDHLVGPCFPRCRAPRGRRRREMLCQRSRHEDWFLSARLAAGLLLLGLPLLRIGDPPTIFSIATSRRADLVSGGTSSSESTSPERRPLRPGGAGERRHRLRRVPAGLHGDALVGLVSGLNDGDNVLTAATIRSRPSRHARLAIRNSPSSGPIFWGPPRAPGSVRRPRRAGTPPASGPCAVPIIQEWFYRARDNTFKPLPSLSPAPADLARRRHRRAHRQLHRARRIGDPQ